MEVYGYVPFVVITIRSFPRSWLITRFVTSVILRLSHVEQELCTVPGHLNSPPVFSGFRVDQSLIYSVLLCMLMSVLFLLTITFSVLLGFTFFDFFFGLIIFSWKIAKLNRIWTNCNVYSKTYIGKYLFEVRFALHSLIF